MNIFKSKNIFAFLLYSYIISIPLGFLNFDKIFLLFDKNHKSKIVYLHGEYHLVMYHKDNPSLHNHYVKNQISHHAISNHFDLHIYHLNSFQSDLNQQNKARAKAKAKAIEFSFETEDFLHHFKKSLIVRNNINPSSSKEKTDVRKSPNYLIPSVRLQI